MNRTTTYVGSLLGVAALSLICFAMILRLYANPEHTLWTWVEVVLGLATLLLINLLHIRIARQYNHLAREKDDRESVAREDF
jgi:uncharacterized membrane protein